MPRAPIRPFFRDAKLLCCGSAERRRVDSFSFWMTFFLEKRTYLQRGQFWEVLFFLEKTELFFTTELFISTEIDGTLNNS